jgi:hypothetical protein
MAKKSNLVAPDGTDIVVPDCENKAVVPSVKGLKLTGSQVLVELLTEQEMTSSLLYIPVVEPDKKLQVPRQGYVVNAGPKFSSEEYGFAVGDRVIISGSGVLAPNYDKSSRERFLMEPYAIKCVLVEDK